MKVRVRITVGDATISPSSEQERLIHNAVLAIVGLRDASTKKGKKVMVYGARRWQLHELKEIRELAENAKKNNTGARSEFNEACIKGMAQRFGRTQRAVEARFNRILRNIKKPI